MIRSQKDYRWFSLMRRIVKQGLGHLFVTSTPQVVLVSFNKTDLEQYLIKSEVKLAARK